VDLYYPKARLVLEYDGGNHRERLVDDDRRQNLLANAGYRLLRFTAADVYQHPDVTVAQVQAALASRTRLVPDVSNFGGISGGSALGRLRR
jgi:very-short-patch-repair endonuclease